VISFCHITNLCRAIDKIIDHFSVDRLYTVKNLVLLLTFLLSINFYASVKNEGLYISSDAKVSGAENIFTQGNTNTQQQPQNTDIHEDNQPFIYVAEDAIFFDENNSVSVLNEDSSAQFDIAENDIKEKTSLASLKDKKLERKISELKAQQKKKPAKHYFSGENSSEYYFSIAGNSSQSAQIPTNFKTKQGTFKETYKNTIHIFISRNTISKNDNSILKNNYHKKFTARPPPILPLTPS
jgi:hypothetical protein